MTPSAHISLRVSWVTISIISAYVFQGKNMAAHSKVKKKSDSMDYLPDLITIAISLAIDSK
jgi:hypothetical protein